MKTVAQILAEMEGAKPAGSAKRPADQFNGEPAPAPVGVAPAGPLELGDARANRPLDKAQNPQELVAAPVTGDNVQVDGESVPVDPNQHWDEFEDELEKGVQAKPMAESAHLVKFSKEDFGAIFENSGLSDEFVTKAMTVFEATVNDRIKKEVARLNEAANTYFTSQLKGLSERMIKENHENQSKYLDYVVTEWVKENEIAIQTGRRQVIAESLLEGIREVFIKHNVDVPAEKEDLVEGMEKELATLKAQLNESIDKNTTMLKMLKEAAKDVEILNFTRGMSAVKADRVKELAESIEFTKPTEFREKLAVLSEGLVAPAKKGNDGTSLIVEDNGKAVKETVTPSYEIPEMDRYLKTSAFLQRK